VLKAARTLNVADQLMAGKLAEVEHLVEQFQITSQALKYSMVPTVAAVDGLALGGGCGGKDFAQEEHRSGNRSPDSEPGNCVEWVGWCAPSGATK
jgi:hypothetical protein